MKVAIVHEWLEKRAGSEKVVEGMLAAFPQASLYALVDFLSDDDRVAFGGRRATTSLLQKLPFARKHFRMYLPLMPFAVERFDLSAFDVIVSSSHAVTKGVLTDVNQLHVSYVHTPMRYAWDLHAQYLEHSASAKGLRRVGMEVILHYIRVWDLAASSRVDDYLANSQFVANRIRKTYRRDATVLYPPVDIERFTPSRQRDDFFLLIARLVPYKRVDVVVDAFNSLGLPLIVVGSGEQEAMLRGRAKHNVTFLGAQPDEVVEDLLGRCRAFVFAAEEDFGITTVEAHAAGAPVIAFSRGGTAEIVVNGETGILFDQQTPNALTNAVTAFQSSGSFSVDRMREVAERFGVERFRRELDDHISRRWDTFNPHSPAR